MGEMPRAGAPVLGLLVCLAACSETPESYAKRIEIESDPHSAAVGRNGDVTVRLDLANGGGREVRSVTVGAQCNFGRNGSVNGTVVSGPLPSRGHGSAHGVIGKVRLMNLSPDLQMTPYGTCSYRVDRVELAPE